MKKSIIGLFLVTGLILIDSPVFSQVTKISGQFRPRYEYRHGYNTLMPDGEKAANFISQRTRLNLDHTNKNFRVRFSLQNVGVWGETGTLSRSDINGTAIHEAWGEVFLGDKFAIKAGRQEIIYDDHRIFGSVDWTQQGRSHDAAILKIKPKENCNIDIGAAYNARRESNFKEFYFQNNYKTFQFAHWHRDFNDFGASILILNNGLTYIDIDDTTQNGNSTEKIAFSQTLGTRLTYKSGKFSANGAFYYQMGETTVDTSGDGTMDAPFDLSAIYASADFSVEVADNFTAGAGLEYLSGNEVNTSLSEDGAFKPFYGTNHKFNGWMDYFYVGNHMNSIGLIDVYLPLIYKSGPITATLVVHSFHSPVDLFDVDEDYDETLGTEADLMVGYTISETATIRAGYSHMFATEQMEVLKGGNKDKINNWAWVMLDLKPMFFKQEK